MLKSVYESKTFLIVMNAGKIAIDKSVSIWLIDKKISIRVFNRKISI